MRTNTPWVLEESWLLTRDIERGNPQSDHVQGEIKPNRPVGGGTACFINARKELLWPPGGLGSVVIKLGLNLSYPSPCL